MFTFPNPSTSINDHLFWGVQVPRESPETYDLSLVKDYLSKNEIRPLLEDSTLFFITFGLALSSCPKCEHYSAYATADSLMILGKEHIMKPIQQSVEQIRQFFLQGFHRKSTFYILTIDMASEIYLRPPGEEVDLTGWIDSDEKICTPWFRDHIHPAIAPLAHMIGARCADVIIQDQVIKEDLYQRMTQDVPALKIEWFDDHWSILV